MSIEELEQISPKIITPPLPQDWLVDKQVEITRAPGIKIFIGLGNNPNKTPIIQYPEGLNLLKNLQPLFDQFGFPAEGLPDNIYRLLANSDCHSMVCMYHLACDPRNTLDDILNKADELGLADVSKPNEYIIQNSFPVGSDELKPGDFLLFRNNSIDSWLGSIKHSAVFLGKSVNATYLLSKNGDKLCNPFSLTTLELVQQFYSSHHVTNEINGRRFYEGAVEGL